MTRSHAWGTAIIILLGAAVLAGGGSQAPRAATPPAAPLDTELSRCRTLGEGAGDDVRCRSAWRKARSRFFGGAAS